MTGAFKCLIVCPDCTTHSDRILDMKIPATEWASKIEPLAEPTRACVREYLSGIYRRSKVIERLRGAR